MRIGDFEIKTTGVINAEVKLKNEASKLIDDVQCKTCGHPHSSTEHAVNEWKSHVIEILKNEVYEWKKRGRPQAFNVEITAPIARNECKKCGREVSASLTISPSQKFLNRYFQQFKKDEKIGTYKNVVQIQVRTVGAYLERKKENDERDYLTPTCGFCHQDIQSETIVNTFNDMCVALDAYFSNESTAQPTPKTIKETQKCLNCLRDANIEITFTPQIPTDPQQFHRIAERWLHRHEIPVMQSITQSQNLSDPSKILNPRQYEQ